MKKLYLIGIVMLIIIGNVFGVTTFFIQPETFSGKIGDEIEFNVNVKDVEDLYGVQFDIRYDENVLNYSETIKGNFLDRDGAETFSIGPGVNEGYLNNYALTRTVIDYGVNGSGTVAKIKFNVTGEGSSSIKILNAKLIDSNSNPIPYETVNENNNTDRNKTNANLIVSPSNLKYGNLKPGENSMQEITFIPGESDLIISVSIIEGNIFDNMLFDIGNGYKPIGSEQINLSANTKKTINSKLEIPIGYKSGNYNQTIIYTVMPR